MKKGLNCFLILLIVFCAGCAQITEFTKVFWGSSTAALEKARNEAIAKTFQCPLEECFEAVLSLERKSRNKELLAGGEGVFDISIKDRKKDLLVVTGIAGSEYMTEVGIFFNSPTLNNVGGLTKIEISSLSHVAKEKCARAVFTALAKKFSEIESAP